MAQLVRMPDGTVVRFADDTPRDEIAALIEDKFPGTAEAARQRKGKAIVEHIEAAGIPGQGHLAFADQALENIPVVGKPIKEGLSHLRGAIGNALGIGTKEDFDAFSEAAVKGSPVEATAGNVFGNVAPLAVAGVPALGSRLLGLSGNFLSRLGFGGLSGSAIAGADTLVDTGGDVDAALESAKLGGAVGLGLPVAGKVGGALWGGFKKALSGAAKGVDDTLSVELKSAAHTMFEGSDAAHIGVSNDAYMRFLSEAKGAAKKLRVNETLDKGAFAALDELTTAADEIGMDGAIELGEMHILRQILSKVAQSPEGRDSTIATTMLNKLDDFLDGLQAADIAGAADPRQAVELLQNGIATWHIARKLETIENAIYKAQNSASGFENGLRVQFRRILDSDRLRQGFSPDEIEAMEEVARGTIGANALKLLGRFGFGGGVQGNAMGGAVGVIAGNALGGPVGGFAAGLGASALRRAGERATERAASNVLGRVASKNPNALTSTGALKARSSGKTVTLRQLLDGGPRGTLPAASLGTMIEKPTVDIEIYGSAA